ncbi:MAG: ABC-type lipoprotein export system permease component LolC [Idiomarinaceae bacterium HL-53]|nr:MAG: ABC-type lipoprotein export system permease component LolC [Idiomarinaceae bacterium HL-53]CUS49316.1 lipoprotein-releasing system permease protein [Idiomarinaceae bacterium HL-53]
MFKPTELFIAFRYSRSKRKSSFTRFIRKVSMLGITLGVMSLIVVTSVMNGFEDQLKTRILGLVPQVTLQAANGATLADWERQLASFELPVAVEAHAPYVAAEGLIQGPQKLQPVLLQGVFPSLEPAQSLLHEAMLQGRLTDLRPGEYGLIVGRTLASQLNVWVGDSVRIIAAEGQRYTILGAMPAQRNFRVVGLFSAGSEIDDQVVFLHAQDAQRLFRYETGHVSGIRLYLDDAFNAPQVVSELTNSQRFQRLDAPLTATGWEARYGRLFAAVKMEKTMMVVMLALVVAVAAFNAISALVLLVQDKKGDIAVLQTLGMTPQRIYQTLVWQGVYTGGVGAFSGVLLGVAITLALNPLLRLIGVSVFGQGERLPFVFMPTQIAAIFVLAIVLTLIATLYPAARAARINPAEILRHE